MNTQQDHEISNINSSSENLLSVGQTLRKAREAMGLSVNDVSGRIKFAPKQIDWLEADDYINLPEAAFVRGFVRGYARLLKLDAVQLLTSLPSSHVQTSVTPEVKSVDIPLPSAFSTRRHNIIWLAAALVVAVSIAIFERMHSASPEQIPVVETSTVQVLDLPMEAGVNDAPQLAALPQVATPDPVRVLQSAKSEPVAAVVPVLKAIVAKKADSVAPVIVPKQSALPSVGQLPALKPLVVTQQPVRVVSVPAADKPAAKQIVLLASSVSTTPAADASIATAEGVAEEHALRMEFDEDAWVEVKDASGKILVSRMNTSGSLLRVKGKSPLLVVVGNAKAVRLFDNGKRIKLERYTTADVAKITLE